jgi:hypothetical protein
VIAIGSIVVYHAPSKWLCSRQRILVVGDEGNLLEVETYRTTHPQGLFKPSKRYLGLMVKGAKEHGLDPEYVRELEAVETIN